MEKISKEAILNRTNYGLNIYSHILRLYYPNGIVLTLKGRDCGLCRNPFNENKQTLHVFIVKEDKLNNALDKEHALHTDTENSITAGDALDFAQLHYKQSGDKLLQTINHEMNLHIGEKYSFYLHKQKQVPTVEKENTTTENAAHNSTLIPQTSTCFSFFRAPVSNTLPYKTITLLDTYNYIVGNYAKQKTEKLRAFTDNKQSRTYKAANFDYCTFSGTFTVRNDKALMQHSNLLCIDFDHLNNVSTLFNQLLKDEYFDTQLLFRSPSGDGLKWIIPIDLTQTTHSNYFAAVANYISQTYGIEVDKSGKDISRACFLPHDPQAFINPNLKH